VKANRPVATRMPFFAVVMCITLALTDTARSTEAYFQFKDIDSNTFVFTLVDASKIKEAREILAKKLKMHIMGTLEKSPVTYNKPWHYHLRPETVSFLKEQRRYVTPPSGLFRAACQKWVGISYLRISGALGPHY
jgi:hypothetical protein